MKRLPTWLARAARLLFLPLVCNADVTLLPPVEDALLPEHGQYSNSYLADWAQLPLGDVAARSHFPESSPAAVHGPAARLSFINDETVHVRDLHLDVRWPPNPGKYRGSLIHIRGARNVLIERVTISHLDSDFRASHSILIEDSENVVIRDVRLAGAVSRYHLRIEGSKRVFVDRAEIAGISYDGDRPRAGGGILISNHLDGGSPSPLEPDWVVVQNCFVHGYTAADRRRNQDAINLTAVRDALIFNCVVRDWGDDPEVADAAIDVSFRGARDERGLIRIERNLILNGTRVKTPGTASSGNVILWTNNVFFDTEIAVYHGGWATHFVHNSFVLDARPVLLRLWNVRPGALAFFHSNLVTTTAPLRAVIFQNDQGLEGKLARLRSDRNLYVMPAPRGWVAGSRERVRDFQAWQALGFDTASELVVGPCPHDVHLPPLGRRSICVPSVGSPPGIGAFSVDRDFRGRPRGSAPTVGAMEREP